MNNVETIRKSLMADILNVIKSSKEHGKLLLNATARAFLFLAEHGQKEPLNTLFNGVSKSDQEGIRLYAVNMIAAHAKDGKASNAFFTYSRTAGFDLNRSDDETVKEAAKAMKAAIVGGGVEKLETIVLGKTERAGDTLENAFNTAKRVTDLIKALARNGEKSLALSINKAIAGEGFHMAVGEIDQIATESDPARKLAAAEKRVETLKAQVARTKEAEKTAGKEKQAA